jgi:hypothetical protein
LFHFALFSNPTIIGNGWWIVVKIGRAQRFDAFQGSVFLVNQRAFVGVDLIGGNHL